MSSESNEVIKKTANHSYRLVVDAIPSHKGAWRTTKISIYSAHELPERKLGEYVRNYPGFGLETWFPFSRGAKDYALYSPDYTCTRIMELPSCQDIGGEDSYAHGFCPVELYVPEIKFYKKQFDESGSYQFKECKVPSNVAFVAGCFWGDDSSWKIQCLDISQVESGILRRDERFGYLVLPEGLTLAQSISIRRDEEMGLLYAEMAVMQNYDLNTGKPIDIDPYR
jgi:hypothetical protein